MKSAAVNLKDIFCGCSIWGKADKSARNASFEYEQVVIISHEMSYLNLKNGSVHARYSVRSILVIVRHCTHNCADSYARSAH